jgi:aldehyde:ferredoxin oxidoreductase
VSRNERDRIERRPKLYGYAGKSWRINLTDSTTEVIPTSKYVPKYIALDGMQRHFLEDIKKPIPALSEENETIYMLGPAPAPAFR